MIRTGNIFHSLRHFIQILFGFNNCSSVMFLDFDGVLATEEYADSRIAEGKDTEDKYGKLFNPSNIDMLEWIINHTNAGIVVTSDWRNYLSIWDIVKMWEYRKLSGRIIGVNPSVSIYRGDEIDKWLCQHKGITNYVIIDDMDYKQFREEQHSHLVTTNHFSGINKSTAQEAVRLLSC
ncbi:MAG: HAD domain-containing protein [Prevotella sp.]|nr:HAD domain-containing protein [Prevotella sp.]